MDFRKHPLGAVQGFSLIEMALTLAILGVLAGLTMPYLSALQQKNRHRLSEKNCEKVLHAVAGYMRDHPYLPRAALSFEKGTADLSEDAGRKWSAGYVPYRTLGLPKTAAVDGWGHPLKYACTRDRMAPLNNVTPNAPSMEATPPLLDIGDSLTILNEKGESVLETDRAKDKNAIAVVVIAFNEGYQPLSVWEKQNHSSASSFIDAPYSTHPSHPFRHYVKWSTSYELFSFYGPPRPSSFPGGSLRETPVPPQENSFNSDGLPEDF